MSVQWLLIAFLVQGVLTAALVFGLPMVVPMLDFEGQNGMLVCIPVWFLGGLLVGMISPGRTFIEPAVASLLVAIPTTFLLIQSQTVRTMPLFLYLIFAAIGILLTLIGAYIGERIQLGPPPEARGVDASLRRAPIVGGGPAGSVCAARLAARGRTRGRARAGAHHPRFHLGESLLPAAWGSSRPSACSTRCASAFLVKRGARFVDGADERRGPFATRSPRRSTPAGTTPSRSRATSSTSCSSARRSVRRRAARGVEVTRVVFEAGARGRRRAARPDGTTHALDARFVVDATGRDAHDRARSPRRGRAHRAPRPHGALHAGPGRVARRGRARGRHPNRRLRRRRPSAAGSGSSRSRTAGRASAPWSRAPGSRAARARRAARGSLRRRGRESPAVARMLAGAERLFAPARDRRLQLPRAARCAGDGWLARRRRGAASSIRCSRPARTWPCTGPSRAADAIDDALDRGRRVAARFDAWETRAARRGRALPRRGAGVLRRRPRAVPLRRAAAPVPARAITSMLSGDVFDRGALGEGDARASRLRGA